MRTPIGQTADSQRTQVRSTSNEALVRRRPFTRLVLAVLVCCAVVYRADAGPGTLLVNENFEDGKVDGFTEVSGSDSRTGVTTGDSHSAGNKAFTIYYPADESSGYLSRYPEKFESIEISFAQKLPDGIPIHDSGRGWGSLKQSRLFDPVGAAGVNVQHQLQYYKPGVISPGSPALWQQQFVFEHSDQEFNAEIKVDPTKWHRQRYWIKFNTPGNRDGQFKYWFNDELRMDVKDISISGTIASRPTGFWVGGNFSYGGTTDFTFRRLIDDVRIVVDGDAPDTNQLTIAPIAKQTIKEDAETTALPVKVSRSGGTLGNVKLTATSSNPAIVPANGLTLAGAGANWTLKAKPAANKHGTTTIRLMADDGAGVAATTFDLAVMAVADTPAVSVTTVKQDDMSNGGLVVTRNPADGAEVTHFKITDIQNGKLYLRNGRIEVQSGQFLTFAQANAGLRFKPSKDFLGTTSFTVRASTSATDAGLGGNTVQGQVLVTRR